jgi:ribonuclease HI
MASTWTQVLINPQDYALVLQFDGSGPNYDRGNDIKSGYGVVVLTPLQDNLFQELDSFYGVTNTTVNNFLLAEHHTNNTGELSGLGHALLYLVERVTPIQGKKVEIRYDSDYAALLIQDLKQPGKANVNLITNIKKIYAEVIKIYGQENVEWKHVKAHSREKYSDIADKLANKGRAQGNQEPRQPKIRQCRPKAVEIGAAQRRTIKLEVQRENFLSNGGEVRMTVNFDTDDFFADFIDVVTSRNVHTFKHFLRNTRCIRYAIKTNLLDDHYTKTNTNGLCGIVCLYQLHLREISDDPELFQPIPLLLENEQVRNELIAFITENEKNFDLTHSAEETKSYIQKALQYLREYDGRSYTEVFSNEAHATEETIAMMKTSQKAMYREEGNYTTLIYMEGKDKHDYFGHFSIANIKEQVKIGKGKLDGNHFFLIQNKQPFSQLEQQWQQEAEEALVQSIYQIFDVHITGTSIKTRQRSKQQQSSGNANVQQTVMRRRSSNRFAVLQDEETDDSENTTGTKDNEKDTGKDDEEDLHHSGDRPDSTIGSRLYTISNENILAEGRVLMQEWKSDPNKFKILRAEMNEVNAIRKAYKMQSLKFHPDKLRRRNLTSEEVEEMLELFQVITQAHEDLLQLDDLQRAVEWVYSMPDEDNNEDIHDLESNGESEQPSTQDSAVNGSPSGGKQRQRESARVICERCNKSFLAKGIGRHRSKCRGTAANRRRTEQGRQQRDNRNENSNNERRAQLNFPKGTNENTLMMDLDWEQIPALIGIGTPPIHFNNYQRTLRTRIFNFLLEKCKQQPDDMSHWKKFALSHAVMNSDCHSQTKLTFKEKAERIMNDDWSQFSLGKFKGKFSDIQQQESQSTQQQSSEEREKQQQQAKTNRLLQMIRKGELSRGLEQYLSDATMAQRGQETFNYLFQKHPREERVFDDEDPAHKVPKPSEEQYLAAKSKPITIQQTIRAVHVQKKGRSHSTCISRAEHIQQLVNSTMFMSGENEDEVEETKMYQQNLTWFMQTVHEGSLPLEMILWMGSTEGNIIKPNPTKHRPIGKPNIYLKVYETIILKITKEKLEDHLSEVQLGISDFGCEKALHTMGTGNEMHKENALISLDAQDAFQHADRGYMMRESNQVIPEAYIHIHNNLFNDMHVYYQGKNNGVDHFDNQKGCQQGKTLSSATFALGHFPYLQEIKETMQNRGAVLAIIDDTLLAVQNEAIEDVLQKEEEIREKYGIIPNRSKSKILCNPHMEERLIQTLSERYGYVEANILRHPDSEQGVSQVEYGIMYVGSPLGTEEYIQQMLTKWLEDLKKDINKIMKITNNQVKFIILRYCLTARLTYFLRTIPFTYFRNSNFFEKYDEILKTLLADITQVDPDVIGEINMMIAKLHCIDGGVGLSYQEDRAVPAYVASYTAALETITETFPSIQILIDKKINGDLSDTDYIPPRLQAYFDGIEELAQMNVQIEKQTISLQLLMNLKKVKHKGLQRILSKQGRILRKKEVMEQLSDREDLRNLRIFVSGQGWEASAFLDTIPKCSELTLTSDQMANAVRRRLQIKEPNIMPNDKCKCGGTFDILGIHANTCRHFSGDRTRTHDSVKFVWGSICRHAKLPVRYEYLPFKREIQSDDTPNDLGRLDLLIATPIRLSTHHNQNLPTLLDVTVVNAASNRKDITSENAATEEFAANEAERKKSNLYQKRASDNGFNFTPLGFEVQGRWSKSTRHTFDLLLDRMTDKDSEKSKLSTYWIKRISITIQRNTAQHIINSTQKINNNYNTHIPIRHNSVYINQAEIYN